MLLFVIILTFYVGFQVHGGEYEDDVFLVVAPCSLVEVYWTFQRCMLPSSSGLIALMMEAASTSETLVNFYQTTRCYIP
jgi:hypothetical protein